LRPVITDEPKYIVAVSTAMTIYPGPNDDPELRICFQVVAGYRSDALRRRQDMISLENATIFLNVVRSLCWERSEMARKSKEINAKALDTNISKITNTPA
jgi:hypothetical protein